jgi:hypothetical protein
LLCNSLTCTTKGTTTCRTRTNTAHLLLTLILEIRLDLVNYILNKRIVKLFVPTSAALNLLARGWINVHGYLTVVAINKLTSGIVPRTCAFQRRAP